MLFCSNYAKNYASTIRQSLDVTVRENLKHVNMGIESWGFLFSVVSSPIVYFLKKTRAFCPNINPIMLCTHVCDVNYAACY